jgi:hypothetical protein
MTSAQDKKRATAIIAILLLLSALMALSSIFIAERKNYYLSSSSSSSFSKKKKAVVGENNEVEEGSGAWAFRNAFELVTRRSERRTRRKETTINKGFDVVEDDQMGAPILVVEEKDESL